MKARNTPNVTRLSSRSMLHATAAKNVIWMFTWTLHATNSINSVILCHNVVHHCRAKIHKDDTLQQTVVLLLYNHRCNHGFASHFTHHPLPRATYQLFSVSPVCISQQHCRVAVWSHSFPWSYCSKNEQYLWRQALPDTRPGLSHAAAYHILSGWPSRLHLYAAWINNSFYYNLRYRWSDMGLFWLSYP